MSIGKNISKYRKAKGLTQEELGAKLGVTNQAVSQIRIYSKCRCIYGFVNKF